MILTKQLVPCLQKSRSVRARCFVQFPDPWQQLPFIFDLPADAVATMSEKVMKKASSLCVGETNEILVIDAISS
jgi:hypothetical protein